MHVSFASTESWLQMSSDVMRNPAAHEDFLTWRSSRNQKSAMELMLTLWRKTEEALGETSVLHFSQTFGGVMLLGLAA